MATDADDDEQLTSQSQIRWAWLASIIALAVICGFMVLVGAGALGYADLSAIDNGWFYLVWLVVLTATGWVFGTDIVKEYGKYKQKK